MSPQIMIVAGEASGDHYAAELVRSTLELEPRAGFFGLGGDRMRTEGVELVEHIRNVQVMGFVEVLGKLGQLFRSFARLVDAARERRPDVVVLVDFPDFNLRLARRLRREIEAPVVYYIGPTLWAWRAGRIETIKACIDKMLVIFPFEPEIYRRAGVDVEYVGHPLLGRVHTAGTREQLAAELGLEPGRRLLALLPGSREHEVGRLLPLMQQTARRLSARHPIDFALGLADTVERSLVEQLWQGEPRLHLLEGRSQELMQHADAALVACGTAPLETALLDTPMVVVYRTQPLNYQLAARLVKVEHVCIVNLVLGREAVPELIQQAFTPERAETELERLLFEPQAAERQRRDFAELRQRLGQPGAARRAAQQLLEAAASGRRLGVR